MKLHDGKHAAVVRGMMTCGLIEMIVQALIFKAIMAAIGGPAGAAGDRAGGVRGAAVPARCADRFDRPQRPAHRDDGRPAGNDRRAQPLSGAQPRPDPGSTGQDPQRADRADRADRAPGRVAELCRGSGVPDGPGSLGPAARRARAGRPDRGALVEVDPVGGAHGDRDRSGGRGVGRAGRAQRLSVRAVWID